MLPQWITTLGILISYCWIVFEHAQLCEHPTFYHYHWITHNLPSESSQSQARTELAGPLAVVTELPLWMCSGGCSNRGEPSRACSEGSLLPGELPDALGAMAGLRGWEEPRVEEGERDELVAGHTVYFQENQRSQECCCSCRSNPGDRNRAAGWLWLAGTPGWRWGRFADLIRRPKRTWLMLFSAKGRGISLVCDSALHATDSSLTPELPPLQKGQTDSPDLDCFGWGSAGCPQLWTAQCQDVCCAG